MSDTIKSKKDLANELLLRKAGAGDPDSIATVVGAGNLSNFTVIESVDEFPEPVGNTSTLAPGTWRVNGGVAMGGRNLIIKKGAVLIGATGLDSLTWSSGSGPRITFDGAGGSAVHDMRNITLNGASGEDMFATTNTPANILLRSVSVLNAGCGLFGISGTFFATECQFIDGVAGMRFGSSVANFLVLRLTNISPVSGATGACLDLGTSKWDLLTLDDVQFSPDSGGASLNALPNNGNLTATTGRGEVESCRFNGTGGNISGGVTVDDLQWLFAGNSGLSNSLAAGQWNMAGNVNTTVADGVFAPVLGSFTADFQHRYDLDTFGVQTYKGLNPRPFQNTIALLAQMASGGAKSISFQMFHVPAEPPSTPVPVGNPFTLDVDNKPTPVQLLSALNLETGDTLQIHLKNNADGVGCTVTDVSGITTGVPTGI